jgi:hypothetical protein
MIVAVIALVMTMGGAAAVALPGKNKVDSGDIKKNAVGASDIRKNAVRTGEVKNRSLRAKDFAPGELPAGPQGPAGPAGASALGPVPSGQTIRGAVGADDHAHDADASDFGIDVSLPMPAANPLGDDEVNVNVDGWQDAGGQTAPTTTDTNAECTGTPAAPTAPPGEVCIYVAGADHAFNLAGYSVMFGAEESPFGFKLKWDASQEGDTFVDATWAYTAP